MAKMPDLLNPTARAIFDYHEKTADDWRRAHLGASIIGSDCTRYLWYTFR